MSSALLEEDDYWGEIVGDTLPLGAPAAASTPTASPAVKPPELHTHGGIPYGTKGKVRYTVSASVSPNQLLEAFGQAAYIPLTRENGFITNFEVLEGGNLATDAAVPKIPMKLTVTSPTANIARSLLDCPSFATAVGEEYTLAHSASKVELNPPMGLVLPLTDGSTIDRKERLATGALEFAHEYKTSAHDLKKSYWQSPWNKNDVTINVAGPRPYIADYNNHEDVKAGHFEKITLEDIQFAKLRNNGELSRRGAFQLIDTLANNAQTLAKSKVPFATTNDLSQAEFRIMLPANSDFNPKTKKVEAVIRTFDKLYLGTGQGITPSPAKLEQGNNRRVNYAFDFVMEFLAFPQ
jgi:hypothetical protein